MGSLGSRRVVALTIIIIVVVIRGCYGLQLKYLIGLEAITIERDISGNNVFDVDALFTDDRNVSSILEAGTLLLELGFD